MSDRIYLTRDGYNKLKEELHLLVHETRKEVLEKIAEARSHGDLSENAEYDAAREEQSQTEARIAELENKLASATILDPSKVKTDKVYILTSVKLKNLDDRSEIIEYTLVSSEEADSDLGKIRKARQGQFSITDRDSNTPHIKKVRVVATLEYYLTD